MRWWWSMLPLLGVGAVHAGPGAAGAADFDLCQACHGSSGQGNRDLSSPRLAGLTAEYVERQLLDFRAGRRGGAPGDTLGAEMAEMGKTLRDDGATKRVASYISTLTAPAATATVKGSVPRGKELFSVCASCHGADGAGNPLLQAPRLAGMSDWYLLRQLQSFRTGVRGMGSPDSPGARMRAIVMTLQEESAMADVIAYIATLSSSSDCGVQTCGPS
jgi:cytochrome c oxidase subunit 2